MSRYSLPEASINYLRDLRSRRLSRLKQEAESLELKPLREGQPYKAIAISVDAGEVPIQTDVFEATILRCADSDGELYFHDVVVTDADTSDVESLLQIMFENVPVLRKILEVAKAESWTDIAPAFVKFDPSDFIREMLELGAIISLSEESRRTIFLKDGLLRTKLIKPQGDYLDNIRDFFDSNCSRYGNYLVGVAKDSAPLRIAHRMLELRPEFRESQRFYVLVPDNILKASWKWERFREGDIPWGDIYLARLLPHPDANIITLEVPYFLEKRLEDVLSILASLPLRQLPDRFFGFPDPLARAHENATLKVNIAKAVTKEVMQSV